MPNELNGQDMQARQVEHVMSMHLCHQSLVGWVTQNLEVPGALGTANVPDVRPGCVKRRENGEVTSDTVELLTQVWIRCIDQAHKYGRFWQCFEIVIWIALDLQSRLSVQ